MGILYNIQLALEDRKARKQHNKSKKEFEQLYSFTHDKIDEVNGFQILKTRELKARTEFIDDKCADISEFELNTYSSELKDRILRNYRIQSQLRDNYMLYTSREINEFADKLREKARDYSAIKRYEQDLQRL